MTIPGGILSGHWRMLSLRRRTSRREKTSVTSVTAQRGRQWDFRLQYCCARQGGPNAGNLGILDRNGAIPGTGTRRSKMIRAIKNKSVPESDLFNAHVASDR